MRELTQHPLSAAFPPLADTDFAALRDDINANGLLNPICVDSDQVLDGWHRYRACQELGIEADETFCPCDPLDYVLAQNLQRRHLTESQRAMVAAKLTTTPSTAGRPEKNRANLHDSSVVTKQDAASRMNVSERSVSTARSVIADAPEPIVTAVETGTITVSDAASVTKEIAKSADRDIAAGAAITALEEVKRNIAGGQEAHTTVTAVYRKNAVQRKELDKPDPPEGKYDVVVIDPPWPMDKVKLDARPLGPKNLDYRTMSIDEITAIDIPHAENCWVFLWTTNRFLPDAIRIVDRWGLRYRYTMVWHKPGGMAAPTGPTSNGEFAIVASAGKPAWFTTKGFRTVFDAPRSGHSVKPEEFYALLREITRGKRIDMFSRRAIDGFEAWGDQSNAT